MAVLCRRSTQPNAPGVITTAPNITIGLCPSVPVSSRYAKCTKHLLSYLRLASALDLDFLKNPSPSFLFSHPHFQFSISFLNCLSMLLLNLIRILFFIL